MSTSINNPILPGFHPDPSIIRVGEIYYIANSTFQWFPGVEIHTSEDLVNWKLASRPLDSPELLDMQGVCDSGGIWAPCLSYADGLFYLIYTNVHNHTGIFKDTPNYLTTAPAIDGPWSKPVYLNSSGFDPSLFHDNNGKKFLLNMVHDHRPWKDTFFGGILLQEYDPVQKKLIGDITNIFQGTELGITEGPHLYQKEDYYYLMTAEGGTSYEHAVSIARSKNLLGPYEIMPGNPLLTSKDQKDHPLQKSGHGDWVETPDGDWFLVHLCSRPNLFNGLSVLGRETALQKIEWKNGWPRLSNGTIYPDLETEISKDAEISHKKAQYFSFDSEKLPTPFQTLRIPNRGNYSLTDRKGFLRLYGKESPNSWNNQTLVAIRQTASVFSAETEIEFYPKNYQQMAGLIAYYDTKSYYYLHISYEENEGRKLHLLAARDGEYNYPVHNIALPELGAVGLRVRISPEGVFFSFRTDHTWKEIEKNLPVEILADEFGSSWRFTGSFIGIACQDIASETAYADFSYFKTAEE